MFFAKHLRNLQQRKIAPLFLAGTGLSLANYYMNEYNKSPSCCGIIGVLSTKSNVENIIVNGVQLLQNRGYDSAGIGSLREDSVDFIITKLASTTQPPLDCIDEIVKIAPPIHKGSFIGVGHTRWATCGGKTDANSHPHFGTTKRVLLVHNGTIDNYKEVKEELQKNEKVVFTSETDSECVAQLIELYMEKDKIDCYTAVQKIIEEEKILGQWGLVILCKDDPKKIVVARQGSPILVGLTDDTLYIASEQIAFQNYTDNFYTLTDGQIMELDLKNGANISANRSVEIRMEQGQFDGSKLAKKKSMRNFKTQKVNKLEQSEVQLKPREPYKYFFEQEINDQPETLLKALGYGSRLAGKADCTKLGGLDQHIEQITDIDNLCICACGTSYYAGIFASHYFKKLGCFNTVQCIEGSEFVEYDIPGGNSAMICVSQSGETADVFRALSIAKQAGLFSMGVINVVGSQLATSVNCGVYLSCGREVAVAATKSFSSQVLALVMMAIYISYHKEKKAGKNTKSLMRKELIQSLRSIPTMFGSTIALVDQPCKEVAKMIVEKKCQSIIVLGKGSLSPIAKEGALKLKELTYIHAEAFSAGELKHGPLALIDPDQPEKTVVFFLILEDENLAHMKLAQSEVRSRNALSIVITDCEDEIEKDKCDYIININSSGSLTPLACVVPFQKITYEITQLMKLNPDKPRNLAKCVTTK